MLSIIIYLTFVVPTVINIRYLQYPQKEWHTIRNVKWVTELFQRTDSHEEV